MAGNAVLIVAAGSGQRLGGELPKQYLPLAGRSVLRRSIDAFAGHRGSTPSVWCISGDHGDLYRQAIAGLKILPPVERWCGAAGIRAQRTRELWRN